MSGYATMKVNIFGPNQFSRKKSNDTLSCFDMCSVQSIDCFCRDPSIGIAAFVGAKQATADLSVHGDEENVSQNVELLRLFSFPH